MHRRDELGHLRLLPIGTHTCTHTVTVQVHTGTLLIAKAKISFKTQINDTTGQEMTVCDLK